MPMLPEFPSIPCMARALDRNDTVVSLAERVGTPCVIQEKVDGANVGFGLVGGEICLRNRNYNLKKTFAAKTPETQQFQPVWAWLAERRGQLDALNTARSTIVVYADWMMLTHGLQYDALPDWALCYSLLDLERNAWVAPQTAQQWLGATSLSFVHPVPAAFTQAAVQAAMDAPSAYGAPFREGIVITFADGVRAKLHHPRYRRRILPLDSREKNRLTG